MSRPLSHPAFVCRVCDSVCHTPRASAHWCFEWRAGLGLVCEMESHAEEAECSVRARIPKSALPGSYFRLYEVFPSGRRLLWQVCADAELVSARLASLEQFVRRIALARGKAGEVALQACLALARLSGPLRGGDAGRRIHACAAALVEEVYAADAANGDAVARELSVSLQHVLASNWREQLEQLAGLVHDELWGLSGAWRASDAGVARRAAALAEAAVAAHPGRAECLAMARVAAMRLATAQVSTAEVRSGDVRARHAR